MKNSMHISIESRRKMVVDWMIELPFGENISTIEKAIDNAIISGKSRKEVINLIATSFKAEIDDYIEWCDSMRLGCFM